MKDHSSRTGDSDERLDMTVDELASTAPETRLAAVERLIEAGARAVPGLIDAAGSASPDARAAAMEALAAIGDTAATAAFRNGLDDADERVRSNAALGLVRLRHPQAMTASLGTINDNPDELHLDITPSVQSLAEMGTAAVGPLIDLLMDANRNTRLHAQRALEGIVARRYGFRPGEGFADDAARTAAGAAWTNAGSYDFDAGPRDRAASVKRLRRWLQSAEEKR